MIRHCGIFAYKYKQHYLSTVRQLIGQTTDTDEFQRTTVPNWRERQIAFTGKDPLLCPSCHKEMILLAILFGSHDNLKQIWDSVYQQLKPG